MHLSHYSRERGGTIVAVLLVVVVVSTLVGVTLRFSTHSNRLAARQREVMKSVATADGALEYSYAVWKDVVRANGMRAPTTNQIAADQRIINLKATNNSTSSPALQLSGTNNSLTNFTLVSTDPWGVVAPDSNTASFYSVSVDSYPGWKGHAYFYKASIKATGPAMPGSSGKTSAALSRYFSLTNVPLFQAAIFYMDNLEIHPGALMTVQGLVHTNANLYAAGYAKLQFQSNVSYVGSFTEAAPSTGDWTGNGTGEMPTITPYWRDDKQTVDSTERAKQLSQVDRIEPFGKHAQELFSLTDTNMNNDSFHEWIEPPVTGQTDPPEIAENRLYNKAGLRIQVDSSKALTSLDRIKITDGYGSPLPLTQETAVKAAIDSGVTMYDWREGNGEPGVPSGTVKVTSLDIKKLNTAIIGMTGYNGVVYMHDVAPGKTAIRLKNGSNLVSDLTVVSQNAVYIQGDYNTGWGGIGLTHNPNAVPTNDGGNLNGTESPVVPGYTKKSAAVIADAVTILSNNWSDSNASKTLGNRAATPTTVNAAFMAGDVPTNYQNNGIASGGAHNFPRFLEMWYNTGTSQYVDFTCYGSMVQAFTSKSFTGAWRTGNVYIWPNRKWNYETLFDTKPPPGTVWATKFSRGRWERM